ncbi:alpha/beta hydrolase [Amycolatopsis sp. H20-H5]|uniref:alpha/beta hydrolase n=1 Tax=Amycolatopsis sp. H20-H5 TaxID=3046309 RepID=UPI002DB591EE|nr:alpha/beta hydrolase [Amycolatopsis sp. H20-H5]MEC3979983.1 alpha/beta hydrolase [Amycolatopsis sp. H20-H5]
MRAFVLVGALAAGTALVGLPGTGAAAPVTGTPAAQVGATKPVKWGTCSAATLRGVPADQVKFYSCASYRVPIDHDNAALGTIDIALLKRAAKTPDKKIGSLFLNPGGPGGSGLRMPISASAYFQPQVLDRFDTVGFDPRGVGASNPLRCFTTAEDADEVFGAQTPVPLSRTEISNTLAAYRDYGQFCKNNAGSLLDHMSTKDVVRDLDLLRAAVGDQKLTFTGFSYGTLIGSTYANMYPKQTRAIVIDGNVDPALRTSDGVQYDRERARGFEISLDGFLKKCQQVGSKCAFSPGQPRAKFDELRDYLRQQPIALPDGGSFDINAFTGEVSGALYSPASFSGLAEDLQALYGLAHPAGAQTQSTRVELKTLRSGRTGRADVNPDSPYTSDDSYFGVNCSDKKITIKQEKVPAIAADWERESPTFGRYHAFSDVAGCPVWPVKKPDVYRGPWQVSTDTPVLVVGNFYDPATQYVFAQRMTKELGNARLLSVDAFGHCILGDALGVDKAAADYLIDLKVPASGQVFQPNVQPFDPPAAATKG